MLNKAEVLALCRGEHGDPFAALGLHADAKKRLRLRSLQPGATAVFVIDADSGEVLVGLLNENQRAWEHSGFFEASILGRNKLFNYRLRIVWPGGEQEIEDPYRFPPVLAELDVWLLAEGSHLRPFEKLGAHPHEVDGIKGNSFAVWAPDAQRVSVIGDFNTWGWPPPPDAPAP